MSAEDVAVTLQELVQSVHGLQTELMRLNNNLKGLQGQQQTVSNISEIMADWMEKSLVIKELIQNQKSQPAAVSEMGDL